MHPILVPAATLLLSIALSVPAQQSPATPDSTSPGVESSIPAPKPLPERSWHIGLLGGVSRWHWEEDRSDGSRFLTEDGWIPAGSLQFTWIASSMRVDASFGIGYGAVDYDGGIQQSVGDSVVETPWRSYTHYSITDMEGQIVARHLFGSLPIQPGFRVGVETRVRTIGSREYRNPDQYGYVETWSSTSIAPLLVADFDVGPDRELRVECGKRFFTSNEERISDMSGYRIDGNDDTVATEIRFDLEPKLSESLDLRVRGRVGHLLIEARYLSERYDRSRINWDYGVLQPPSNLDRFDLRAGWRF